MKESEVLWGPFMPVEKGQSNSSSLHIVPPNKVAKRKWNGFRVEQEAVWCSGKIVWGLRLSSHCATEDLWCWLWRKLKVVGFKIATVVSAGEVQGAVEWIKEDPKERFDEEMLIEGEHNRSLPIFPFPTFFAWYRPRTGQLLAWYSVGSHLG